MKGTTKHCYMLNTQGLALVVLEKIFSPMADIDALGPWPIWTPGAWLAGFMKATTKYCCIQHIKALDLVVSEKRILLCFSHCKSMGAICWKPQF